jgi:hypothetical protein
MDNQIKILKIIAPSDIYNVGSIQPVSAIVFFVGA